jgi:stress response protein SCP2
VLNKINSQEITRYELSKDLDGCKDTAMIVASLNREGPKWHFRIIGETVAGGLAKIATDYDITVLKQ